MAGIRIRHATERNTLWLLADAARPYAEPLICLACTDAGITATALRLVEGRLMVLHLFKTYHLRLDDSGCVIVSATVWEKLQRIPGQPFTFANVVEAPPMQTLVLPRLVRRAIAIPPATEVPR